MSRAVAAEVDANAAEARAAAAASTTGARYNSVTVANRIEKLGTDMRRLDREASDKAGTLRATT